MGKGPLFRIFVAVVCIKQVKMIEKTRHSVAVICLLMFVNNVGSSIYFLTNLPDFLQKSRRAPAISQIALSHMENMNFVVVSVLHRTEVNDGSTVRRWLKFEVRNLVCRGMNPGRLASDKD